MKLTPFSYLFFQPANPKSMQLAARIPDFAVAKRILLRLVAKSLQQKVVADA
jgi:hypothetical protein